MTEIYTYKHAVEEAGRENITTVAATYGAATFKAAIRIVDVRQAAAHRFGSPAPGPLVWRLCE
jgi:hypothetical protein